MSQFVGIGGGIAGLAAANALAGTGAKVTILEQARELGGRARTRHDGDGFLNLGPHALYAGGVAARTFAEWDVHFSGGNLPPERPKAWALFWYVETSPFRPGMALVASSQAVSLASERNWT
jgi:phytoene dehydrogenase-like protein